MKYGFTNEIPPNPAFIGGVVEGIGEGVVGKVAEQLKQVADVLAGRNSGGIQAEKTNGTNFRNKVFTFFYRQALISRKLSDRSEKEQHFR